MCSDVNDSHDDFGHRQFPFFGGLFDRPRINRGDMSPIILRLLANEPMHGYQIIRTLEEKSHGFWRPSAGSVYPILQLLTEQGLVVGKEVDGKTVYSLTPEGEQSAKNTEDRQPWHEHKRMGGHVRTFAPSIAAMFHALKQISHSENTEAITKAKAILDEAESELLQLVSTLTDTNPKE